ncbi:hypothetical protein OLX02_13485 [Novosphingobium sp. KCTC 2891]|uniref:hypothetical protein n=1 Tax=Novosphingobium sp. KCTC 2891 TaxID=2989730 RepID=UPI0022238E77|nr:hypothetical protein [Novosphingobium sp. KCTC 2891]MCW1383833.1 hypothetical protein [Novosphingobium sp. KCTC 2891]
MENFQAYFQNRVKIDYDDTQGVLVVSAQAFDPQTAQAIVQTMVSEGEAFMNRSDHDLVAAQVPFLEGEAERTSATWPRARR